MASEFGLRLFTGKENETESMSDLKTYNEGELIDFKYNFIYIYFLLFFLSSQWTEISLSLQRRSQELTESVFPASLSLSPSSHRGGGGW